MIFRIAGILLFVSMACRGLACAAVPAPAGQATAVQASAGQAGLLTDYTHTAWTDLDGAPVGVTKFAQGPDGWLWIGTPTGLYRYDGVQFERTDTVYGHALQSSNIMALTTTPDGALWVGYRVGGISVFSKEGTHTYMENDGVQPAGVMHLEAAPDGAIWAAMRDGVAVLPPGGKRFRYLKDEAGLPARGVFQVLFARDGTTWIGTNSGAYFRRPGETRFTQAWPRKTLVWLAEAPDGTLWGNDFEHGYHRVHTAPPAGPAARPELAGVGMYFDRQGTMWMLHTDSLERKLPQDGAGRPDQFLSPLNGISGAILGAIFQDREGNLWIGTSRGIDRLRPNRLHTVPVATQLEYPALVAGPSGDMWVGDYARDLWRYGPGGRIAREVPGALTASYTAPDGVMWLGGMEGIVRRAPDGTLATIPYPGGLKTYRVHAMQQDRDGALWASFNTGDGVYKLVADNWIKSGVLPGIPGLLTTSMARDGEGALWMAQQRSQVTVVNGGTVRTLGPAQGLALGTVLYLCFDGKAGAGAVWAGGEYGVALYRNGRFIALHGARDERFRGVSGIVRLPDGDLWLHGADGLYRIAATELDAWLNSGRAVDFERFDARDGMQGHAAQLRPVPSLRRSRDGLLWYATTGSVGTIDPAGIPRNRLAPPVDITAILADGVRHAIAGPALRLPQGTRSLQVDFTALSLSIPERVRLRYRLVGLDRAWQETSGQAGRRQANYTNLAPGHYRFEVIAANEDGLWNTEGAALDIGIPPTFVQSAWFKLLLAAAGLLLLYAAYALRIRYLTRRMRERLHERLAERTRIARTLHDTLLQSMQSLLLSFDAHSRYLKEGSLERTRLDQTLDLAERLLVEGRDQIMELRETAAPEVLELTLGRYGKGLADHGTHAFDMHVTGTPRQLRPDVHEEIYAIAREALFNASRYADATRIELGLDYGSRSFAVRIRDNGRGLAESVAAAGGRPGHWGLVGMRERAASIGATLDIDSKPGAGTDITVTLPARKAY
ncbi:sensor histidine kinase [Pseudoduganella umbonata]|uniref:Histidine kinase n=1 Tax=Pseudoduganella umbonata TaxID=864828 RepID=A0A4P8HUN6_9BURK|nr:sensor histidine kinase [Pseudoduganella umbonata]MBB3222261.1 signal transduction histidine kinase/ligand-binding sensor domain-containing protein [Pseudoduganella umbonata]QCP12488.1 histidine kinase [Pseudoduganella umbonata]